MTSDITQQYLEGVLKFKARKELSDGFLTKAKCEDFLKELTIDLEFDFEIWFLRKRTAKNLYIQYQLIRRDEGFRKKSEHTFKHKLVKTLINAINLDPFNKAYLKEYLFHNSYYWKPEKKYKLRYLRMHDSATSEFSSILVDLGLSLADHKYDYFDSGTTGPYIDALIFLKENNAVNQNYQSKKDLETIAKEAGIDKKLFKELDGELKHMLETLEETQDNHWLQWKDMHKALLVVDKLVDLAPYNPKALHAAIHFYGHSLWRSCLDSLEIRTNLDEQKAFFKTYLGNPKPKSAVKITAAQAAFDKAKELEAQFLALPKELFELKKDDSIIGEHIRKMKFRMNNFEGELTPEYIQSFMLTEKSALQVYLAQYKFKRSNKIFAFIIGAVLFISVGLITYLSEGSFEILLSFGVVPCMAAVGIAHLRALWWKRKILDV